MSCEDFWEFHLALKMKMQPFKLIRAVYKVSVSNTPDWSSLCDEINIVQEETPFVFLYLGSEPDPQAGRQAEIATFPIHCYNWRYWPLKIKDK